MINLKNKYNNHYALLLLGGESCFKNLNKLKQLDRSKFIIFLESKTLTKSIYHFDIKPDYLLATFPNKLKDNSLQNFIFRSFLRGSKIKFLLKKKYHYVYEYMKCNFDNYFEPFNLNKGPHKRYKFRKNIFLQDSPMDVLKKYPNLSVITNYDEYKKEFPTLNLDNKFYYIKQRNYNSKNFNIQNYFNPTLSDDFLNIGYAPFLNSAAINIYPILNYMGFKKVFFLGMDMNMLGSMEYSANLVFKNMLCFRYFIYRNRKAFNANYKINFPFYYRPKTEFDDLKMLNENNYIDFIRITNQSKFSAKINYLKSIDESIFYDKYSNS